MALEGLDEGKVAETLKTANAGEEQPAETEGEPTPQTPESVVIDGETVPLTRIQEWRKDSENKSRWQAENTRKAQELAAERRALEGLKPAEEEKDAEDEDDVLFPERKTEREMKQLREKTAELESRLAELQRAEQDAFLEGWLEEQEKIAAKTYPLLNRDHVRAKLFFSPEVRSGDGDYAALGKVFQRLAAESHKQQEAAFETYMKRRTAAGKPKGPAVGGQGGGASSAGGAAASNQPPLGLEGDGKFNLIRLVASKMRGT